MMRLKFCTLVLFSLQICLFFSSTTNKHSKTNLPLAIRNNNKNLTSTKLQKENDPSKEEYKNPQILKSLKVSVANDLKDENVTNARLPVQIDLSSSKKIIKIPKSPPKDIIIGFVDVNRTENIPEPNNPNADIKQGKSISQGSAVHRSSLQINNKDIDDYKSPLEALHSEK